MAADTGELVQLYVYDLSGGMARGLSQMLLGRQIEAVYHTSIVVAGIETFFGGGINQAPAGATPFGRPMEIRDLGRTQLDEDVRAALLAQLSERYTPEAYSLLSFNCNNFSDELAQLLCGRGIPAHITGLPAEVLSTPFGQMIAPMLSGLEAQLRGMRQQQAAAPPAPNLAAPPTGAVAAVRAAAGEGPALAAAETQIESAVAAGMMEEAQRAQRGGGAPDQAAKAAVEAAVQREFERLMAAGGVGEQEARALALEAVAVQQSLLEPQPGEAQGRA